MASPGAARAAQGRAVELLDPRIARAERRRRRAPGPLGIHQTTCVAYCRRPGPGLTRMPISVL